MISPDRWIIAIGKEKMLGPYSEAEVRALVAHGKVQSDCMIWREGWNNWQSIYAALPGIPPPPPSSDYIVQSVLGAAAPPLPIREAAPADPIPDSHIYLFDQGKLFGPYSRAEAMQYMREQRVSPQALVSVPGWSGWKPIHLAFPSSGAGLHSGGLSRRLLASDFRYPGEGPALVFSVLIMIIIAISLGMVCFLLPLLILVFVLMIRVTTGINLGNCARVSENSFPRVHRLVNLACHRLDIPRPKVYIMQDPTLNAYAIGFGTPYNVVLHSALVDALDDSELLSVIGHELSHIKCGHTKILALLAPGGFLYIPIANLFKIIFMIWGRRAEYTCDRGGLLACQSLSAAVRAEIKLIAGPKAMEHIQLQELLNQAREVDANLMDSVGEFLQEHPYGIRRIKQIVRFYASPQYRHILQFIPEGEPPSEVSRMV